jgi:mycothiol synthase
MNLYTRIRRRLGRWRRWLLGPDAAPAPEPPKPPELQMVWPPARRLEGLAWTLPEGFELRPYQPGDEAAFFALMDRAGFPGWNLVEFQSWLQKILPGGFVFVVHQATNTLAATAMACHNPTSLHPFGGTLSCVAATPEHQGRGLGYVVTGVITRRLVEAGYTEIYMVTDDWRLPAIKTYFKMGWEPFLYQPGMADRWQAVCAQLNWPYTPEAWRGGLEAAA